MKIKKFIGKDYQEALQQAKNEMGSEAIILNTKNLKKPGILGIFTKARVEITVALDDSLQVNMDRMRNIILPKDGADGGRDNGVSLATGAADLITELQQMKEIMTEIKSKMYEVDIIRGMTELAQKFYTMLVNNHVDRDIALHITKSVETRLPKENWTDEAWANEVCLHTIQEYIKDIEPIKFKDDKKGMLIFMIGPTGVGKTTTIAKLAANMTFVERKNVALITLDTYRVAAVEQLKTFAEIIDVPVSVVFKPGDLMETITNYRYNDIIFVDTAGRSPYNSGQMQELQECIDLANPDEVILVLSVATDSSDLISIYRQFSAMNISKIIFTKIDETKLYGQILNTICEIKKPVAYLTNGQNVPDDIFVPDKWKLAHMLLGRNEA